MCCVLLHNEAVSLTVYNKQAPANQDGNTEENYDSRTSSIVVGGPCRLVDELISSFPSRIHGRIPSQNESNCIFNIVISLYLMLLHCLFQGVTQEMITI